MLSDQGFAELVAVLVLYRFMYGIKWVDKEQGQSLPHLFLPTIRSVTVFTSGKANARTR